MKITGVIFMLTMSKQKIMENMIIKSETDVVNVFVVK